MAQPTEQQLLEQYAAIVQRKILSSQADLNIKDRAMPEMLSWCRQHPSIVVLQSGSILSSEPASRLVQNCKIVMHNKGLVPGMVFPATSSLIRILLENAEEIAHHEQQKLNMAKSSGVEVSSQQQRLRILVKGALDVDATDIHIEVRSDIAKIRFRKHGELFLHAEWPAKLAREVVSVAFNKETDHAVTHFNPLVPQGASMPLQIDNNAVRLRLASLPAHQGFDVVMRILTTSERNIWTLEQLGYLPEQVKILKRAIAMPSGAVILAGPTGSGKTSTLASCMSIVGKHRKVYSIEDPVEKIVSTVTQVPVNTDHDDRGFASMARTALRMDPDVVVLGEMRDEDTASVMVRAAITGHLVFSTLHTNSAHGIITRLMDLGIQASLLASQDLLVCLICQRLAPILCTYCAVPIKESTLHRTRLPHWENIFGHYINEIKVRGHDCAKCQGIGIGKRKAIAEMIWVDEPGRQFILKGDLTGWRHQLLAEGWMSYYDHLLNLVIQGQCDPQDAEAIVGELVFSPRI